MSLIIYISDIPSFLDFPFLCRIYIYSESSEYVLHYIYKLSGNPESVLYLYTYSRRSPMNINDSIHIVKIFRRSKITYFHMFGNSRRLINKYFNESVTTNKEKKAF